MRGNRTMAPKNLPHIDLLRQLIDYDPDTGVLRWLERTPDMFTDSGGLAVLHCQSWNSRFSGKVTGYLAKTGYLMVKIGRRLYSAHRLAWAIHHGIEPADQIDHINGERADNRIINLRSVSASDNSRNQKMRTTNTTGVMGVNWHPARQRWVSNIYADGRRTHLGYFRSFDAAVAARKAAEVTHGFHSNHGRN
jgi:hypothetical protein